MTAAKAEKPIITLDGVTRSFGSVQALRGVSAEIREGEFFSLLGPSGCGKTTLLRMIAGFDEPTTGTITLDGKPMAGIAANHRPTNMVFQSYAIFPHLSVADNVGYGLKKKRLPKAEYDREVEEALKMVSLGGYGPRAAHTLSGGQRQRVGLARALYGKPVFVVLDEPNSSLDEAGDAALAHAISALKQLGTTFVVMTHRTSVLGVADKMLIMRDGAQQAFGPRDEVLAALQQKAKS